MMVSICEHGAMPKIFNASMSEVVPVLPNPAPSLFVKKKG